VAPEGEALHLSVKDTGCGITSERLEELLDGDYCTRDSDGLAGAGLGLSMVRRLVDLMDGRLWIDSEPGQGSRFSVLVPLPHVITEEEAKVVDESGEQAMRVLVVEDNPVNQLVARKLLESLGLEVDVVMGGREAIPLVGANTYDLVFMDLQMPVMDGFETTRALRSEVGFNGPVVAMTAHATQFHRDKCRHTGMNGFVTKPLERKRLADFLDSLPDRGAESVEWLWLEPEHNRPLAGDLQPV